MILNLYKNRGETPLQVIQRLKEGKIEGLENLKEEKMTYLGRLDPMAEGVLLIASGEEDTKQKRKEEFLSLDKDYDFTALFGFATDTYDCLGRVLKVADFAKGYVVPKEMDLIKICKLFEGERDQKYPKYSSVMIDHPEIDPPIKKITIYKMQFKKFDELKPKELFGRLLMDISKVKGDFRQAEILEGWKEKLLEKNMSKMPFDILLANFSASVSSGTYIRSIVNDMGATLGCGALALSITRTRVGNYLLKDSQKF
ncbi:MAG: hypothetical protein AAB392_00770 [Patescibacteria group bacterium]